MPTIDLNADLGEGGAYDDALLQVVSSCNIACGGHAGDARSMQATVVTAAANGVAIGAHPAYPDREGFGRRSGFLAGDELRKSLIDQIAALDAIAAKNGATLTHVKPHGALYNDAVNDRELADLIVSAVNATLPGAAFVGLPGSELRNAAIARSVRFVAEGFVDRAYQANGQLVPRSEPGAVHDQLEQILSQAVSLVGKVDTLCVHGDTPGAAEIAREVRK
ncbi:MAG: 5-oxoprolinase subunit PxpA, partial [Gammaproteobacteria bacterium]|nr:5-oxoprolinase subunit PxpA [Gammaproteobacteria bacterium]